MSLVEHAKSELAIIGYSPDLPTDDPNKWMYEHIIKMVETFSEEGHSGFSASYAISLLQKLLNYEPLTPLTGEDDEWIDVSEIPPADGIPAPMWQNKRCSHVFKDASGAYDINGKIFVDPDGSTWTNGDSKVPVTFPYTPERVYVHREEPENE
jgi:hypothetical protein